MGFSFYNIKPFIHSISFTNITCGKTKAKPKTGKENK
jgi:hypothetical protein